MPPHAHPPTHTYTHTHTQTHTQSTHPPTHPLLREKQLLQALLLRVRELAGEGGIRLEVETVLAHHHARGHAAVGLDELLAEPALGGGSSVGWWG